MTNKPRTGSGYRPGGNRSSIGNGLISEVTPVTPVTEPCGDAVPAVVPNRHLYRIPEAMLLLSMSRSVIYEVIRSGRLRTVKEGRARFVPAKAITDYIALLIEESGVEYDQAS